jgi:sulfatase maturation enzyme AslB (radical SAM superfamily)
MSVSLKLVRVQKQFLYIEPTSVCNLHCKMCYTNVINGAGRRVIAKDTILDFIHRFRAVAPPPVSIYWCGTGEVFLHPHFPEVVNSLLEQGDDIEQTIQTNGTTPRRLYEFTSLERLGFRVSIDGYRPFHEWHRGPKTYDRTLDFCRKAVDLGCRSMEIRCLLTRDNIQYLDELHADLLERIGPNVRLSPGTLFTNRHLLESKNVSPLISRNDIDDSLAINEDDARQILRDKYQDRYRLDENDAVDNYISLNPYGVYTCCNGMVSIGDPETDMDTLMERLVDSEPDCYSCSLFPCQ